MLHYNYIFAGTGLAALMTVYKMQVSGNFQDKTILLLDSDAKKINDRTWCFWHNENHHFEKIVSQKWYSALFINEKSSKNCRLQNNPYQMIKGLDFYEFIFNEIAKNPLITFKNQKVVNFEDLGEKCTLTTNQETYSCNKVFTSILDINLVKNQSQYPLLSQHFIGWFVKTKEEVFNPEQATFMDFSVPQKENTRFMYVLPSSKTEALVEYTLFSPNLLPKKEYEEEIEIYLKKLGCTHFEILDKEQGNIPMTCYKFWKNNSKNIINIGSSGGWTKASTGFTFASTQKKTAALVAFLSKNKEADFRNFHKKNKFWFYDLLFIDVLFVNNALGSKVFSSLFKKEKSVLIFKFLDEETSFLEDLQVMLQCPTVPFFMALIKRLLFIKP